MQLALNRHYERMRATKHAPCGSLRVLERRHGLAEIVERGGGVHVVRARLGRDSDGLIVFSFRVVLFRATAPLNPTTKRLVSAPLPVLALAGLIAISGLAPTTPFLVVVGQWGGAGGAVCEDHF